MSQHCRDVVNKTHKQSTEYEPIKKLGSFTDAIKKTSHQQCYKREYLENVGSLNRVTFSKNRIHNEEPKISQQRYGDEE
jgi:hypothetical protein